MDTQSPTLQNLPTEILIAIFREIQDPQSLLNICLQSRYFNEVAEPVLYANFSGPDGHEFRRTKSTKAFHSALLRKPELAQHVRSMSIQAHWTQIYNCSPEVLKAFASKELAKLFPDAHTLTKNGTPSKHWLAQNLEGPEECLLLTGVPKLETLHLSVGWYPVELFEKLFTLACDEKATFLKRLRNLRIVYRNSGRGLNLSNYLPLLRLPSLSTVEAFHVSIELDDERQRLSLSAEHRLHQYRWQPNSLNFETLKFHESAICGQHMCNLLHACKTLKVFQYSSGSPNRGYEQFSPSQLYPGLIKHRHTLEVIRLIDISTIAGRENERSLGSFAEFPRLKIVGAEQEQLVGRPALERNCLDCRNWECNWARPVCKCLNICQHLLRR
jgi:hypothetical protein